MSWYVKVLKQYVDFSGRARRREIWMFILFNALIGAVLTALDALLGTGGFTSWSGAGGAGWSVQPGLLAGMYNLLVLIPSLAVAVRRLHDTDRSAWWLLLVLVPVIGWIALVVLYALNGTRGANQYGPDPKERDLAGV
jgi:uncharacterized membrane protein YhaH (DUF805 family)